jgi:type I restriction enzyme M protein
MFWTGGITNPLDVIEQITYLMFIHELDEIDTEKSASCLMLGLSYTSIFDAEHQDCRWSQFKNYPAQQMYATVQERVFPFIKGLHGDEESAYSKYMADAIFKIPTAQLLEQIVTAMDEIDWKNSDIRGDLYEYLLSKIATAGTNGQFRTPRHIIKMMVNLVEPKVEDIICEQRCLGLIQYWERCA